MQYKYCSEEGPHHLQISTIAFSITLHYLTCNSELGIFGLDLLPKISPEHSPMDEEVGFSNLVSSEEPGIIGEPIDRFPDAV